MSLRNLIECQHCKYKAIKRLAKKKGLKVTITWCNDVYVHPPDVHIPKYAPELDVREKYLVAWLPWRDICIEEEED